MAKKKRIDTRGDRETLTDNPFGALAGLVGDGTSKDGAAPPPQAGPTAEILPRYFVAKTRKGNWPVAIEKRGGGKIVTILRDVEGDGSLLLKELKKQCATGGALRDGAIELQGDQRDSLEAFLDKAID